MNRQNTRYVLFFLCFFKAFLLSAQDPDLAFRDTLYTDRLKTVQFYPVIPEVDTDVIFPPVLKLGESKHLRLEFDLLETDFRALQARIYYCSTGWDEIIPISRMRYLDEYNEFNIFDREFSSGTRTEYCHYSFDLPKVKLAGNYIIQIIETTSRKPLLEHRFIVYSEIVQVDLLPFPSQSNVSSLRQFNITVNASNPEIETPMQSLRVFIRKNGLPHTQKGPLKVTYYNQVDRLMKIMPLDGSNTYEAGNEYRKFDARSRYFSGMGILDVRDDGQLFEVILEKDEPRRFGPYLREGDINGRFVIDNYEFDNGDVNSDYFFTLFSLDYTKAPGNVYVYGALTNWNLLDEFKMEYNPEKQEYACVGLLKQGYYNYMYVLEKNGKVDYTYFSGSFRETENYYEVLVYYNVPGRAEEYLVGYLLIEENGWND